MAPKPAPLPEAEVASRLADMPAWERQDRTLVRMIRFETYMSGIDFVNQVASRAEQMDHHPDLLVGYRKVTVRLTSHDAGGITARDFSLAQWIDQQWPPRT